jgi:hypothetical protein
MDGSFDPRCPERFGQAFSGGYLSGTFCVSVKIRSTIGETLRNYHAGNKQGLGPRVVYRLIQTVDFRLIRLPYRNLHYQNYLLEMEDTDGAYGRVTKPSQSQRKKG